MKNLIIYDDFYNDPLAIRTLALDMVYEEAGKSNYPGVNSEISYFSKEMGEFFCWITGDNIKPATNGACGHFRKTIQTDTYRQRIHIDLPNLNCSWAGVLYLNPDNQVQETDGQWKDCGTKFWKHKALGLEHCPMDPTIAATYGFSSLADVKTFMDTEGMDETLWHETMRIPPKFNRLVVFRPWLWHSIGAQFGSSDADCRLTQLFFFEPV